MSRFKIGALFLVTVFVQVCSTISLGKEQSLVKRNAFIGEGDIGRLVVRRDLTNNLDVTQISSSAKSVGKLGQSHTPLKRRNAFNPDLGAVKNIGNQVIIPTVRRDPQVGTAPVDVVQRGRANAIIGRMGAVVVRRDTMIRTPSGDFKSLDSVSHGSADGRTRIGITKVRRNPFFETSPEGIKSVDAVPHIAVVRRDPLLGTAPRDVRSLDGVPHGGVTATSLNRIGIAVVRRDPVLGTSPGAVRNVDAVPNIAVFRRDPVLGTSPGAVRNAPHITLFRRDPVLGTSPGAVRNVDAVPNIAVFRRDPVIGKALGAVRSTDVAILHNDVFRRDTQLVGTGKQINKSVLRRDPAFSTDEYSSGDILKNNTLKKPANPGRLVVRDDKLIAETGFEKVNKVIAKKGSLKDIPLERRRVEIAAEFVKKMVTNDGTLEKLPIIERRNNVKDADLVAINRHINKNKGIAQAHVMSDNIL